MPLRWAGENAEPRNWFSGAETRAGKGRKFIGPHPRMAIACLLFPYLAKSPAMGAGLSLASLAAAGAATTRMENGP